MPEWLSVPVGILVGLAAVYGAIRFAVVPKSRRTRSWFAPRSGEPHDHHGAPLYYGTGERLSDHSGFDGGSGHGH